MYDNVAILNGTTTTISVTNDDAAKECRQDWRAYSGFAFPASPRWQENGLNWMTPNQETLVTLYGWTSLVVLIVFVLAVFGGTIFRYSLSWIRGMYKVRSIARFAVVPVRSLLMWSYRRSFIQPSGIDQKIDYSNVDEISAYVPQIRIRAFPWPLLCCDVNEFPDTLIGWTDPHNNYDIHNLIYDVPYEGSKRQRRTSTVPANVPATISEHEDEDNESSTQKEDEATTEKASAATYDAMTWPIYSIVKYYPRSFPSGTASS